MRHKQNYTFLLQSSGAMVSMFAIGPKVRGLNTGHGNGLLRAIKICSMLGFACTKILQHTKNLA
jgi:hypothetical protein